MIELNGMKAYAYVLEDGYPYSALDGTIDVRKDPDGRVVVWYPCEIGIIKREQYHLTRLEEEDNQLVEYFELCPFCGRRDEIEVESNETFYRLQGEYDTAMLGFKCKRCNAELNDYTLEEKRYEVRFRKLLDKWNVRN